MFIILFRRDNCKTEIYRLSIIYKNFKMQVNHQVISMSYIKQLYVMDKQFSHTDKIVHKLRLSRYYTKVSTYYRYFTIENNFRAFDKPE